MKVLKVLVLVSFYLPVVYLNAQEDEGKKYPDNGFVNHLIKTADRLMESDPESAIYFLDSALVISRRESSVREIIKIYNRLGLIHYNIGLLEKSLAYHTKSAEIAKKNNLPKELAYCYTNMAVVQGAMGDFENRRSLLFDALEIFKSIDHKKGLGKCYNNIGNFYMVIADYDKSTEYYLKALRIQEELDDKTEQAYCLGNLANISLKLKRYDESYKYLVKSYKLLQEADDKKGLAICLNNLAELHSRKNEPKKSLEYNLMALDIKKKLNDRKMISTSYNNIGTNYESLGQHETALEYFQLCLELSSAIQYKKNIALSHRNIARIYFYRNDYSNTFNNLNKSYDIITEIGDTELLGKIYKDYADYYAQMKDYQNAYQYHLLYSSIHDSIFNLKNSRQITNLQLQYDLESKDNEIKLLEKNQEIKDQEIHYQRQLKNFMVAGFLFIILATIVAYFRSRSKHRLLLKMKALEFERKSLLLQMSPHFLFNALSSINSFITNNDRKQAIGYLSKFANLIRFTLDNTQHSLISIENEAEHLENYLKLEQLRFNNIFEFTIEIRDGLRDQQIPSMLVQPIVENAVLHGISGKRAPGKINISYYQSDNRINCEITDDGIGRERAKEISEKNTIIKRSLGLSTIEKRLATLNELYKDQMKLIIEDLFDQDGSASGTRVLLVLSKIKN